MDSVTVQLEFSQPLDPSQSLDTSVVTVRHLPDSARVAVSLLASQSVYDSLQGARRQQATPADSGVQRPNLPTPAGRATPDTVAGRSPLITRLILGLAAPMDTSGQYTVDLRGVRNVTGISADVRGVFSAPKPQPVGVSPSDSLAPDSLRTDSVPADTLRARPDSTSPTPGKAATPKP